MNDNTPLAVVAGLLAALVGAAAWAAITVATNFQIGFMAIGVGLLCGFAVAKFGKGAGPVFGAIGAGTALFGCVLGNLWTAFGVMADIESTTFLNVLTSFDYSETFQILSTTFDPIDVLFYGLAVWEGFKLGGSGRWRVATEPSTP